MKVRDVLTMTGVSPVRIDSLSSCKTIFKSDTADIGRRLPPVDSDVNDLDVVTVDALEIHGDSNCPINYGYGALILIFVK